ncbi:hypothetical protein G5I_00256 [Acromyrmex echinatior]|uniref:Uncharacterized protein n=1 Tax=Acromyrmex echinatior TaxID=103372 RepID=F4W4D6_ACREC|nr:hypothetical protein G5I_00256 [Acromyrmex echinatior]
MKDKPNEDFWQKGYTTVSEYQTEIMRIAKTSSNLKRIYQKSLNMVAATLGCIEERTRLEREKNRMKLKEAIDKADRYFAELDALKKRGKERGEGMGKIRLRSNKENKDKL